jgi:acetylornithine deacetylase
MSVVSDLERLVAFETVSHRSVLDLCAFVAQRWEDRGLRVRRVPEPGPDGKTNLVATIGPEGTDGVVLSGHMDVVPVEGQPWTSDPFALTRRGDRLVGRGSADMLGFLAATTAALERFEAKDFQRQLVLVWTCDEEVGCLGSAQLVPRLAEEAKTWPRACLIGEPTDFQILRMHPGHVKLKVEVSGEAAHSSKPHLGRNAIETAAEVVLAIRDFADQLRAEAQPDLPLEHPWVMVNTGLIEGGAAINVVPDRCVLKVGYRPLPGMDAHAVYHRLEHWLAEHFDASVRPELGLTTPSMLTAKNTSLAAALGPHATPSELEAASFATDGGNLARMGMQPLICGPGSIDVAHKADEYVEIGALHDAVEMVSDVIAKRCVQHG